MDPARAAWYAEQGLHTICPTQHRDRDVRAGARARSVALTDVRHHRRRRQGRLEPRARAHRQGQRGHADRAATARATCDRAGARARRPVRRRHRAVGPRARRHPARRPRHRRHRRRRGQHPHLPDRQGEVPLRADHRPRQQPAQPPALRAAGHPAGGLRDRPDPAPDRARGARPTASSTCSTCPTSSSRSSRSRSRASSPAAGRARLRDRAARGRLIISVLRGGTRLRAQGRHGHRGRRRGPARARPGPRGRDHRAVRAERRAEAACTTGLYCVAQRAQRLLLCGIV